MYEFFIGLIVGVFAGAFCISMFSWKAYENGVEDGRGDFMELYQCNICQLDNGQYDCGNTTEK